MRLPRFALRRTFRRERPFTGANAIWGWVLCAAAVGVVAVALLVRDAYQNAGHEAELKAVSLAATAEQDVRRNLELLDMAMQATIGRLDLGSPEAKDPARYRSLIERLPRDQYVGFIQLLDANGEVVASTPPTQGNRNWSDRDYFRALIPDNAVSPFLGRPYLVGSADNAAIPIARRVPGPDGRFAGVMVTGMRLANFRELFSRLGLGPNDTAALLRDDGTVLMRFPFNRNDIGDTLDASAPFHTYKRNNLSPITATDPIDRVERQFVFRHLGALPLTISVGLARHDADAAATALLWMLSSGLAVFLALLAWFASLLTHEQRQRLAAELDGREKSRFLTTLSHELRTPLHGVLGYADHLSRDEELSSSQAQQVGEVLRAARHMRDVVNIVLDYARIEARGPTLHMRRFEVRALAQDCLAIVHPAAIARGLETRIAMAPGTPDYFVADDMQLRQILTNLLSNAVKYTPAGLVELRLMGDEDHLTVEVVDTGIGIPEGRRHQLFKEYERFGTERTSIEGTGLGLAIAHRLARRMGGHMGHRNNPGGGSIFWIELPAGAEEILETSDPAEESVAERCLNVLVADDSEVNCAVAAAYLRKAGHQATEVHDGATAVQLAAARDFDVVLMDMRMAGMDGLEATRHVRSLPGSRGQVPIVAVTANALDAHADECRRAGMSDYLAKPFAQAELLAVVSRAAVRRPSAVIDPTILAEITDCVGEEAVQRLLDCLGLRIEALLRQLEAPPSQVSDAELAELAHELIGSGGTLGFTALAAAAARFEAAVLTGEDDAIEIRREAAAASAELRRRRSPAAMLAA